MKNYSYLMLRLLLVLFTAGNAPVLAESSGKNAMPEKTAELLTYARLYTGDDGQTHFEDVVVNFKTVEHGHNMPPIWASLPGSIDVKGLRFFSTGAGWDGSKPHPAPNRQFFFVISGEMEFITSDGESRVFGPGDVFLVEDVSGIGHTSRMVSPSLGVFAVAPLAD